jgi:hypothetical protein
VAVGASRAVPEEIGFTCEAENKGQQDGEQDRSEEGKINTLRILTLRMQRQWTARAPRKKGTANAASPKSLPTRKWDQRNPSLPPIFLTPCEASNISGLVTRLRSLLQVKT